MKKTLTPITSWLILGAALAGCGDEGILTSYCGDCHTGSPETAWGGLDVIDDVDALIERGLIIPGSRLDSPVYTRIAQGSMPPAYYQRPVSDADLERIGKFIDAL